MEAKCPYCTEDDTASCKECEGRGLIAVDFAEGALFTIKCLDPSCGFENGGRIVGPDYPALPEKPDIDCVMCGFKTEYSLVGWSGPVNDGE